MVKRHFNLMYQNLSQITLIDIKYKDICKDINSDLSAI